MSVLIAESLLKSASLERREVIGIDELNGHGVVVTGADFEFVQLEAGRLATTLSRKVVGHLTFNAFRHSLALRVTGWSNPETVTVVLLQAPATVNGILLCSGDVVLVPPGSNLNCFTKAACGGFAFTVRTDDLARFSSAIGAEAHLERLGKVATLVSAGAFSQQLAALGDEFERSDGQHGTRTLIASAALTWLCEALALRFDSETISPTIGRFFVIVSSAERYLEGRRDDADAMTLPSICQALSLSPRTVQAAFQTVAGVGPCEYDRIQRLHAVRRELIGGARGAHVSAVALRHGFSHFGRFAGLYREFFGETPSITLRRSSASVRVPI